MAYLLMIRRLFFFALGLLLGSWSVWSFAAPTAAGSRINLNLTPNAPSGVTVSAVWDAVVPGLEDTGYGGYRPGASSGSAEIYRGVAVRVDGVPAALEAKRVISARNLAKGALSLAKRGGPVGLIRGALVTAGLQWAVDEWWKSDPDYSVDSGCFSIVEACQIASGKTVATCHSPGVQWMEFYRGTSPPAGWTSSLDYGFAYCGNTTAYRRRVVSSGGSTPQPQQLPASDQDIEDLLTDNLVDGDLTPEDALRELIETGNASDGDALNGYLEPVQASGPSSVPGATKTSSTSSPAGQTETTTATNYGIAYGPGGVVTITKGETTTTTTPDGQTTTTTSTESPAAGQNPKPADEKPLCELFPDASGCEKLGDPDEDIDIEEKEVQIPGLDYTSVTGTCPAPIAISNRYGSWELSYDPVCTAAEFLRPVIILAALLTAGMYVFVTMRGTA